jgi:hypothetical protein
VELVVTVGNTDTKAIADISAAVSIISATLARKLIFLVLIYFGEFKMLPLGAARKENTQKSYTIERYKNIIRSL